MLIWRLFCYSLLVIGLFLFAISILSSDINYFYWSLGCYALASLIWLTIKMLYIEPFTADNCQHDHRWTNLLSDVGNGLEIILALPKFVFNIFIKFIWSMD